MKNRRHNHRWLHLTTIAVALAAFLDAATFLVMGTAHELNPLAASHPYPAVIAKALLAVALVLWPWRYRLRLQAFGALAWTVGAVSNALVIWR